MNLNEKQQIAYNAVRSGKNVFITGPGGVGKSHLINQIMCDMEEGTVLMAPTGVAAQNIMGATIHSTFGLPFGVIDVNNPVVMRNLTSPRRRACELFSSPVVKRIIIDEISMVRADTFTAMDRILKEIKRSDQPFGGLQVVVIGDFYQIPPVVGERDRDKFNALYSSPFAFDTRAWSGCFFESIELDEVVRQKDKTMVTHLMNIRDRGDKFVEAVNYFKENSNTLEKLLESDPTIICCTNAVCDEHNLQRYDEIEDEERTYHATESGEPFKDVPVPRTVNVKLGMRVILAANDYENGFMNGDTGYVVAFNKGSLDVVLDPSGHRVKVTPFKYEQIDYGSDGLPHTSGTYSQMPILMGWAATVHKMQGKTLDRGIIDFGRGCFVSGQAYVALSRIRSIEGIAFLTPLSYSDVICDNTIREFYARGCRSKHAAV